jgi:glyoxylase I family protein
VAIRQKYRSGVLMRLPGLSHVDHIGLTVPNLDAAVKFYCDVLGSCELYRLGPFDAAELPRMADGRDWTEAHINVAKARLSIAMLSIGPNLMLELFQYDLPADRNEQPPRNCDFGGHHIAFKVENLETAKNYLAGHGCKVTDGPIVLDQGPCATTRVNYVLKSVRQPARTGRIHNAGIRSVCAG